MFGTKASVVVVVVFVCIVDVSPISYLHFSQQLSQDAANLVKNLVTAPSSLLLGKGAFFVHVNDTIFQVLKGVCHVT